MISTPCLIQKDNDNNDDDIDDVDTLEGSVSSTTIFESGPADAFDQ